MALFRKFIQRPERRSENQDLLEIVANLNNILNTKRGYGALQAELGINDMNEFCSREHIALAIEKEVKENIQKYEPRIESVKMTRISDDNPMRLSFQLECTLRHTARSLRLVFDSVCNSFNLDPDQ